MKLTTTIIFLITVLGLLNVSAQADYRSGYVIVSNGDTIYGKIDITKHKVCSFRSSNKQKSVYQPQDITGFGFSTGRVFRTIEHPDSKKLTFFEVNIDGEVSLFSIRKKLFLLSEKKDALIPLIIKTKVANNGVRKENVIKPYVGALTYALSACSALKDDILNTSLTKQSVSDLLVKYHECQSSTYVRYDDSRAFLKLDASIQAGVYNTEFEIEGSDVEFSEASATAFGVKLAFTFPRISNRFSLNIELVNVGQGEYLTFNEDRSSFLTTRNFETFNYDFLMIPIGIRYTFPERLIMPYIFINTPILVSSNGNSSLRTETQNGNLVQTQAFEETNEFSDGASVLDFGGGMFINAFKNKFRPYIEYRVVKNSKFIVDDDISDEQINGFLISFGLKYNF